MSRRLVSLACMGALSFACATGSGASAGPKAEQQRVKNIVPFDLANCFPPKLELPRPANEAILAGFWVAAQPQVQECVVDPGNRGADKATRVNVTLTVSENGQDVKVAGTNLSAAGKSCVENVFKQLPPAAPLPKGKKPVLFTGELQHNVDQSLAVEMGVNEVSDMAGLIRLSEKSACECFAGWQSAAPHPLKAKVSAKKPAANQKVAAEVVFEPSADPASQAVAQCLTPKVAALPFTVKSEQVAFTYQFTFTHSGLGAPLTEMPPNVQVMQLDGIRGQSAAQTAFKLGQRANSAMTYDTLVRKFKANSRSVTVKELKDKCHGMLKSDEDYAQALQSQLAMEQQTVSTVGQLKTTDARWTDTDAASQKALADTQKELASAKSARVNDEKACPRLGD